MSDKSPSRCPICQSPVATAHRFFPFCSSRCRQIDLGNWLGERYAVPGDPEQQQSPDDDPQDNQR